jgi:hypothetical protein
MTWLTDIKRQADAAMKIHTLPGKFVQFV